MDAREADAAAHPAPGRRAASDAEAVLRAARLAHERADWAVAREQFAAARMLGALTADDVSALGDAAWWLGEVAEALDAYEDAYRRYLHGERPRGAAMAALTIAVNLFLRGDGSGGTGWMSRARRLLADAPDSREHGYVLYLTRVEAALDSVTPADPAACGAVVGAARRVQDLGRRHGDASLVAIGTVGEGRALVRWGRVDEGLPLLDEAVVAVRGGEVDREWAGNVYCHLMAAAHELADVRRLVEWTETTTRWLATLPAAVLFTGICRVHRSQVLEQRGAWTEAEAEAARVCEELTAIQPATAAEAHYQIGDIRRLRGDLTGAEEAYRRAHELGRDPQPGFALLRLAQGQAETALASVDAALAAVPADNRLGRARLCAARAEIALAAGEHAAARAACEELEAAASAYGSPGLEVMARHARGALALGEGRPREALGVLRDACRRWQDAEAPYDCARVRMLLADAYAALGDEDAAQRERDAAIAVFARLGAALPGAHAAGDGGPPAGLTEREAEVLACVAAGRTNRQIASELVISEKTVARHLSNIFTKLDVSSRTQAAAYAYAHGLAPREHG